MLHITLVLAFLSVVPANAEILALFRDEPLSSLGLAQAVNHYVALGEQDAIKELKALVSDSRSDVAREIRTRERIGWVCRVLYQPKGREPLRAPMYGALTLPHKTMPLESWPLYPIAHSGATYFVLSEGYTLAGLAEDPADYLAYCGSKGRFRKEPIPLPSREQALTDAKRLRNSAAWKAIKWMDEGSGFSYSIPEGAVWDDIEAQGKAIPAK